MSVSKEQQLWDACTSGDLDLVKHLANDPAVNINWADPEFNRTSFFRACGHHRVAVVEFLLKLPNLDVNNPNKGGFTPINIACQEGHKEVVSLLLTDLRVDVNKPSDTGATPFNIACQNRHEEVVSILLADMRININQTNHNNTTPLWMTSQFGFLSMVQLFLASGREIETKTKTVAGTAAWNNMTAAEVGRFQGTRGRNTHESDENFARRKRNGPFIANLIDSFDADPVTTRQQLRELPELRDTFISDLFALVIFLCDDLLIVSPEASVTLNPNHSEGNQILSGCPTSPD